MTGYDDSKYNITATTTTTTIYRCCLLLLLLLSNCLLFCVVWSPIFKTSTKQSIHHSLLSGLTSYCITISPTSIISSHHISSFDSLIPFIPNQSINQSIKLIIA
ncbi:hypothetical protein DFJ63DRAFT_313210 [Scheffersomyces coipomensis]|uniref:uncharacterized protein n=1 Tax=Scheffersomyces coipomensis TaxID=1788519 RepID=UPI00315CFD6D